jgi:hypothetical protein
MRVSFGAYLWFFAPNVLDEEEEEEEGLTLF